MRPSSNERDYKQRMQEAVAHANEFGNGKVVLKLVKSSLYSHIISATGSEKNIETFRKSPRKYVTSLNRYLRRWYPDFYKSNKSGAGVYMYQILGEVESHD